MFTDFFSLFIKEKVFILMLYKFGVKVTFSKCVEWGSGRMRWQRAGTRDLSSNYPPEFGSLCVIETSK